MLLTRSQPKSLDGWKAWKYVSRRLSGGMVVNDPIPLKEEKCHHTLVDTIDWKNIFLRNVNFTTFYGT